MSYNIIFTFYEMEFYLNVLIYFQRVLDLTYFLLIVMI